VVDNASSDGSVAAIREMSDVDCIALRQNLGYSGAINVGRIRSWPFRNLLVVNADVRFEPGSIAALLRAVDTPGVGVVVPALVDPLGDIAPSQRRFPTILRALGDALCGSRWPTRPGWLSETVWDDDSYRAPTAVDWATGAAVLVSGACDATVGQWDTSYFLYSEEVEYATRARAAGFGVRYVPSARVLHREGGSGRSAELTALLAVNRIRYFERHHHAVLACLFRAVVVLHELLRVFRHEHRVALRAVASRSSWERLLVTTRGGA
jgi:GT2 family glycosyltransferase